MEHSLNFSFDIYAHHIRKNELKMKCPFLWSNPQTDQLFCLLVLLIKLSSLNYSYPPTGKTECNEKIKTEMSSAQHQLTFVIIITIPFSYTLQCWFFVHIHVRCTCSFLERAEGKKNVDCAIQFNFYCNMAIPMILRML